MIKVCDKMRLFTAINFTAEIRENLYNIINQMKSQTEKANFTLKENLHLTLVFIGEKDKTECNDIISRLSDIKFTPFEIIFENHGRFQNLHWIGIRKNQDLAQLQERIANVLEIKPDFNYTPHITLAREVPLKHDLVIDVPQMKMTVDNFSLMKSEHINRVLKYTEITSHPASIQTKEENV